MSKITLTSFMLLLVLLFTSFEARSRNSATKNSRGDQLQLARQTHDASGPVRRSFSEGGTGTLQKMIVQNGSVTMDLDLNQLNGINSTRQSAAELRFAAAANSFFTIFVFNGALRATQPGSMALARQNSTAAVTSGSSLPASINTWIKELAVEKLPSGSQFDLAVRDTKTGFTLFNIEGHQYEYDARAQLLSITGGRLRISKELAKALGRPSDAGAVAGRISIGAAMQPIEINQLVNGELKSLVMPPLRGAVAGTNSPAVAPGPDVIVGDIEDIEEPGNTTSQVGLDVGTTAISRSIGLLYLILIIRSSLRTFIG